MATKKHDADDMSTTELAGHYADIAMKAIIGSGGEIDLVALYRATLMIQEFLGQNTGKTVEQEKATMQ